MSALILLFTFVSAGASEGGELTSCGILNSEIPSVTLNAYGYEELRNDNLITVDEALIWEYSSNTFCDSNEYYESLDKSLDDEVRKLNDGTNSLGRVFRNGFKDKCRYRAIVSKVTSPFKFLSKFERRIQTMSVNGEVVSWFVHESKKGIKFVHSKSTTAECFENDI